MQWKYPHPGTLPFPLPMGSGLPQIQITTLPSCSAAPAVTAIRSAAITVKGILTLRATTWVPEPFLQFSNSRETSDISVKYQTLTFLFEI
jgi:hypothetical protein